MSNDSRKIRILMSKVGLDGHDRGVKVVSRALRDAGFEVIYSGLQQTPEMIVNTAVDEDVHVIGMSILSGAHRAVVPLVIEGARKQGLTDALFLVGGIIPDADVPYLKEKGVHGIFTPGASLTEIVEYIKQHAPVRD